MRVGPAEPRSGADTSGADWVSTSDLARERVVPVRLGIYVKNLRHEDGAVIRKALRRVFVRDTLPASTWLGVTSLALDELLIEVEATAVIE